jgi:hypothetical protein
VDEQVERFERIIALIRELSPEFRAEVLRQLAEYPSPASSTEIRVSSAGDNVRIDFARPLAWWIMSRESARLLAVTLLEHSGLVLENKKAEDP